MNKTIQNTRFTEVVSKLSNVVRACKNDSTGLYEYREFIGETVKDILDKTKKPTTYREESDVLLTLLVASLIELNTLKEFYE